MSVTGAKKTLSVYGTVNFDLEVEPGADAETIALAFSSIVHEWLADGYNYSPDQLDWEEVED